MVKVGIRCQSCKKQLSIQVSVGHVTPRWATHLWKTALAEGWVRREEDHAVFCTDCKTLLSAPSTRITPVAPLQFVTLLECEGDGCGIQIEGDQAVLEKHFNRHLRARARELGWFYLSLDRNKSYQDYCPACGPKAMKARREYLAHLVWSNPTRTVAWELGVSDKAVEKQCVRWGVPKPPRGFWAKWHAGDMEACRALVPEEVVELVGVEFLDQIYPLVD